MGRSTSTPRIAAFALVASIIVAAAFWLAERPPVEMPGKVSGQRDHGRGARFDPSRSAPSGLNAVGTKRHADGDVDLEPLAPGERREIELVLPAPTGLVWFGRVTLHGVPHAGARVRMLEFDEAGHHVIDEAESDTIGLVRFAVSSWGAFDARVDALGSGLTVTEIVAGHGTPATAQELPLWPVATLLCTVVDPAGSPIPGIEVCASVRTYELRAPAAEHAYSPEISVSGTTDANGVALLADLPAELWINFQLRRGDELLLEEQRALLLDAGSRAERRFVVGSAGRVSGLIDTADGRTLAAVRVDLTASAYAVHDELFFGDFLRVNTGRSTTTDAEGRFLFDDVAYGTWYVGTAGDPDNASLFALAPRVVLSAAAPSAEVNLRLEPGLMIEGHVVDENGDGASDVKVQSWSDLHGGVGRLSTEIDGAFRFGPLPAGPYSVRIQAPEACVTLPPIEVQAGALDVRIVLRPGLLLRGSVVDAITGTPIDDATVRAYAPQSEFPYAFHGNVPTIDGRFELTQLPAGEIVLRATTGDGGIGSLRGIRVRPGKGPSDVTIPLHRGISVRVRYVGAPHEGLAILALQDGVVVTYISTKPGETSTFWAMPGPLLVRVEGDGVDVPDRSLVVHPGDHPEIILSGER